MKRLYDIAHARAGDKGETSNIAVFCYKKEDYKVLVGWLIWFLVRLSDIPLTVFVRSILYFITP
jgi:hypothetical protein